LGMIEGLLKDPIVRFLLENSCVTRVQADALLVARESKLKEAVKLVERGRVSKGSFVRTLRQGQRNVEACVYTLFLMSYLGLLNEETTQQLGRTVSMMSQVKDVADGEQRIELLRALREFGGKVAGRKLIL
jgi:hypothetical protein